MLILLWFGLLASICTATGSPEVDSSEHGVIEGNRSTSCKCGWANRVKGRIVGGNEYGPHEYPFSAGVSYDHSPYKPFCGAVIISAQLVLTAAHCTAGASDLYVTVGEHDRSGKEGLPTVYEVKKIINHEKFHPVHYHKDISLLILDKPIEFSSTVGPVCLPLPSDSGQNLVGQQVRIIGWGSTKREGGLLPALPKMSNLPKKIDAEVIDIVKCNTAWPNHVIIRPATQICTLSKGTAPCEGDDGGPVIKLDKETNRYFLVGLVSYGPECTDKKPSVQTDVTAFINWININIMDYIPGEVTCKKK
uniref:Venom S1 protease 36 n=1 Tax=Oncocephalus sp. TaxID=2944721 RepID=A0AB38ZEP1_9HEMI